jgi:hypothetical protein
MAPPPPEWTEDLVGGVLIRRAATIAVAPCFHTLLRRSTRADPALTAATMPSGTRWTPLQPFPPPRESHTTARRPPSLPNSEGKFKFRRPSTTATAEHRARAPPAEQSESYWRWRLHRRRSSLRRHSRGDPHPAPPG